MTKGYRGINAGGGRAVLITGASSGIGRHAATAAARRGFTVFATVRRDADAEGLRGLGLPGLVPICPVDLSDSGHIAWAVEVVSDHIARRGLRGLFALINNAGGGSPAPIELLDPEGFHTELKTRLLGATILVQSLLPLLRQAKGRILWIMTPALIPTPYVASIHACDFGANCLARTLDIELKPWPIPNVMVRCGGIRTRAGLRTASDVHAVLKKGPRERAALYESLLNKWAADMAAFDARRTEPERVAHIVLKALLADEPRRRYAVGHMARAAGFLETLPQPVADWILRRHF
jgi:NAD(P)-dependent dehydrogenase (short-subunit alcohol dehydrogenase family)